MNFDDVPKPFVFMDGVLFNSQFARMKVSGTTKAEYEKLFDCKLNLFEEIDIPVGWLGKNSRAIAEVVCPRCSCVRKMRFDTLTRNKHSFCQQCTRQMAYDEMLLKKVGNLTVLKFGRGIKEKDGTTASSLICMCSCGKEVELRASHLKSGQIKSCGTGKCSPSYNPLLTDKERRERRSGLLYREVLKEVRKRDRYKCWFCGYHGFIVHHLNDFANHPEERASPDNLVCVCNKCHNDFHKWSGGTRALTTTLHNYLYKYYIMSLDRTLDK